MVVMIAVFSKREWFGGFVIDKSLSTDLGLRGTFVVVEGPGGGTYYLSRGEAKECDGSLKHSQIQSRFNLT
jgi:hypothetical protein